MTNDTLCKTDDEVKAIIAELQIENPNLDTNLIIRAIKSCCFDCAEKGHEVFISCVKERIKMLKQM